MPEAKRKPVTRELASEGSEAYQKIWPIVEKLITNHHDRLEGCDIALVMNKSWRADADGAVQVAKLTKAGPMDRALRDTGRDFALEINEDLAFSEAMSTNALEFWIDNALCAAQPELDKNGEQRYDDDGDACWRLSKPHLSLFLPAYERHGAVTEALANLRNAVTERLAKDRPLLAMMGVLPAENHPEVDAQQLAEAILEGKPEQDPQAASA